MAVMSSQVATGGVQNLRAIFEHRYSDLSSSSSRRRTSNTPLASPTYRPLGKNRTSFVTIERPSESGGPRQLGLRKVSENLKKRTKMANKEVSEPGLGSILKGSPFEEPGKPQKTTNPASTPAETVTPKANTATEKATIAPKKTQEVAAPVPAPAPAANATKPEKPPVTAPVTQPQPPIQEQKSPIAQPNPSFPKPRGGGAKIQAVMESAKEAREARAAAAQAKTESAPKKDTSKAPTPTSAKIPRASLPARLSKPTGTATAPTASSIAKNESNTPTEPKPAERKAVARGPPRVANATTASSLAKKSARASLGVTEQSKPRTSLTRAPADEGFLARMMRPTASSAQKTHEKVQTESPPQQKSAKPVKKPISPRKSLASVTADDEGEEAEAAVTTTSASEADGQKTELATANGQETQQPSPPSSESGPIPHEQQKVEA